MRGTLAWALPVPRDSAVVFFPAIGSLPCGWILLDCIAKTARLITSGLMGVWKTAGRLIFPVALPCKSKISAVFCAIFIQPIFLEGTPVRYMLLVVVLLAFLLVDVLELAGVFGVFLCRVCFLR